MLSRSENGITSPPSSTAPGYMDRSLPPTPVTASRQELSVNTRGTRQTYLAPSSPTSPSIYTETRPTSRASITAHSRCNSPSIANLDRLSVVKQRLAQIERGSSQSSCASGLTSPMWSPQTPGQSSCATPLVDMKEPDDDPNRLKWQRASSVLDSILSSYGDVVPSEGLKKLAPPVREPKDYFLHSRVPSESGFQPVVETPGSEILHDHSCCPPLNMDDQVLSLQHDVQDIAHPVINCEPGSRNFFKAKSQVNQRTETYEEGTRLAEARTTPAEVQGDMSNLNDAAGILQALQSMRRQLATDLPAVLTTLSQIQEGQTTGRGQRDSQATSIFDTNGTFHHDSVLSPTVDLSELHAKLDELLVSCNGSVMDSPDTEVRHPHCDSYGRGH
jgi:hypothetical protein